MVTKEAFLDYFEGTGGHIQETVVKLGLSLKEINSWIKKDKEFRERLYSMQKEQLRLTCEDRLAYKILHLHDKDAIKIFLQARVEEYSPKKEVEQVINFNFLNVLTKRLPNEDNKRTAEGDREIS